MISAMPVRDKTLVAFGRNLARIRAEKSFTQDKLAEKADLDRTFISGVERGLRNPGLKTIIRISKALNVTVAELCKGVDE
jgi:transcriptional regulator with XRE-family HTH domain